MFPVMLLHADVWNDFNGATRWNGWNNWNGLILC